MQWQSGIPDSAWDDALFARNGHFLQSSHWAAFNAALDTEVFYSQKRHWQCLALVERTRTGTRLYCPYGPVVDSAAAFGDCLRSLATLAREQHALFVRIEPRTVVSTAQLAANHLKRALKDIQPPQTWVQDLTKSDATLVADMTATNRNLYRNYRAKGLTIRECGNPSDMTIFIAMMREVAAANHITPHTNQYYQTMADVLLPRKAASLYISHHDGAPVASAFVFDSPTTRYYAHAASYGAARKLHPGTPLLAQMIFDAKSRGQKTFDFVGVAPEDANEQHAWAGFSRFKRSFGGHYVQYVGTWELPTHPLYRLYRGVYKTHAQLRFK